MRWEDQELNHSTPETKFPEVFFAGLELPGIAEKKPNEYLEINQGKLDAMIASGELNKRTMGVKIDRLCLHFRLFCSLGPGGDHYPTLGVMHFWSNSVSKYAVFSFSPRNDWLKIMVVTAPASA
jgi:hypothetical protein